MEDSLDDIKTEIRELRLGNTIRKLRQERRLTYQELADLTGLSKPVLSQTENDQVTLPIATLLKDSQGTPGGDPSLFRGRGWDRRTYVLTKGEQGAPSQRRPKNDAPEGYHYR